MNLRAVFLSSLLLMSVWGCGEPTHTLIVDLRSDLVPVGELGVVEVSLDGSDTLTYRVLLTDALRQGVRVGSWPGLAAGMYTVHSEFFGADGRSLGQKTTVVSLQSDQAMTLVFSESCRSIRCPREGDATATECNNGACASPECTPETPEACGGTLCATADQCPASLVACAVPSCMMGVCLFEPVVGSCGEAEVCSPGAGCVNDPRSTEDAGPRDAGPDGAIDDVGVELDAGMNMNADAGMDMGICGMACTTPNPCELGMMDCSTGEAICVPSGAGNLDAECRPSAGVCDLSELCDGLSTECPADLKQPTSVECRARTGECDVAEMCDGASDFCPSDGFESVGSSCSGGFCNELHVCSDGCSPGAACSPADSCRTGSIECTGGVPSCVADGNAPNGTSCSSVSFGSWGSCGAFSDTCDETGQRSRSMTTPTCNSGSCNNVGGTDTGSCSRSTGGLSCGAVSYGSWGGCGGYGDTCDENGTRSRSSSSPTCNTGICQMIAGTNMGGCSRSTGGLSCGTVSYGTWGSCGSYSDTCDESGSRTRSVTTPTCSSQSCQNVPSSENGSCGRSTGGLSCGSVTYGSWGSCGGFGTTCDESGTRSRSMMTPACASGSCQTTNGSDSGSCSRSTTGVSCGTVTYGPWSICGGFSTDCDESGSQSRTITTPTCAIESCDGVESSENRPCLRSTDGDSCPGGCVAGTCSGESCTGGGCTGGDICVCVGQCGSPGDECF